MKKLLFFLLILTLIFTGRVLAQTTATPSPVPTNRIDQIKERVEERIQEIKDKAQTRAFWGTITEINSTTLAVKTPKGDRRVRTAEDTTILLDNKTAKLTDLGIGNFVIVIGNWDNKTETLTAKRIAALTKPPKVSPARQAIFGKVSDITAEEKILVVTHPKKLGVTYEVKVTSKTVITKFVDGKVKKVNFDAIAIGDRVAIVALKDTQGSGFTAKIVHDVPGNAVGQETMITPSPTVSTTPTPTVKVSRPTPTPTPQE